MLTPAYDVKVAYPHWGERAGGLRVDPAAGYEAMVKARQALEEKPQAPAVEEKQGSGMAGAALVVGGLAVGYVAFSALMFTGLVGLVILGPLGSAVVLGGMQGGGYRRKHYGRW